jgi:pimeloyl-ACP methyl ester carboxylesterase
VTETDLGLGNGRALHVYDTGAGGADGRLAVFWHRGTPNIGTPPEPLFVAASRLGIRWVSYDRPGYGRSTPTRAGTLHRPPPTSPLSPTRWALTAEGGLRGQYAYLMYATPRSLPVCT